MSYAGLGLTAITLPRVGTLASAGTVRVPSGPMVDVGVDRALVNALIAHLDYVWASSNRNPSMSSIAWASAYLKAIRPNIFSRLDPAKVATALRQIKPESLTFVDRSIASARTPTASAMVGYTPSKMLSDIASGKFAGRPAPAARPMITVGLTRLAGAMKTAAAATTTETKAAADKAVETQAKANEADLAAKAQADKAAVAAEEARLADEAAKAAKTAEADRIAKEAAAAAEATRLAAEQAARIAAEVTAAADQAQRELEIAAEAAADVPAQQQIERSTEAVAAVAASNGPLGVSWKVWGIGAVALVGGYMLMSSRPVSKNRRRVRRNRRR